MAYTEFYCIPGSSGGSNLNAGSTNSVTPTVAAVTGSYTSLTYTATSGTPFSGLSGDGSEWCSIYKDGTNTTAKAVGRITSVGGGGASVTVAAWLGGTPVGDENRCIVGGAWKGPNGAVTFPHGFIRGTFVNAAGDCTRLNLRNDAEYDMTATSNVNTAGPVVVEGFSAAGTPGDGGFAVIDCQNNNIAALNVSGAGWSFRHIEAKNSVGVTNEGIISVISGGTGAVFYRCIAHHSGRCGFDFSSVYCSLEECEAYSNTHSGFSSYGAIMTPVRCNAHDNGAIGFSFGSVTAVANHCLSFKNTGAGYFLGAAIVHASFQNCDSYRNGGTGFSSGGVANAVFTNCNASRNTGVGYTCYAGGTFLLLSSGGYGNSAFSSGNVESKNAPTYNANTDPWTAPETGDFTLADAAAVGDGRGTFLFTGIPGTYTAAANTTFTTDIGACLASGGSPATYAAVTDVRYGTDRGDGQTGTCYVPAAADVQFGVNVDATTGTLVVPAVGDVQSGVTFGAAAEFTGTFVVPAEADVRLNTTYGASAEFTGEATLSDWTETERKQIRYRFGIDGTTDVPTASQHLDVVAVGDWSATEKEQIRYRLGIDGTPDTPAATPELDIDTTGDWTDEEKQQIRYRLGIDGTPDTPTATPALGTVNANVILVGGEAIDEVGVVDCNISQIFGDAVSPTILKKFLDVLDQSTGQIDSGTLAAGAIQTNAATAAQVAAEVADALNTDATVAGVPITEALRRIGAITSGKVSQAGSDEEIFSDYANSVHTIVIAPDAAGNRLTVTYN